MLLPNFQLLKIKENLEEKKKEKLKFLEKAWYQKLTTGKEESGSM